ncbi:type VI secretion system protein TssA [Ideonella sp.]|uniref:type VI secretion system protein TssA n=1 Tax=Ideonella sp. TaxID=1929293 RepID=UPI0035B38378
MPDFDVESLLSPLAGDAPCGADLEYDPAFLALQAAGSGRAEQQYGDTVIAAEEPDWPAVHEGALQLAGRTRDLRLAVWLARCGARLDGWAGAVRGLQMVRGLLERHWDHVHPQLDASENNDPTARLNALMPLVHAEGLADLRAAVLTGARGGPTVRQVELATGRADALPGEAVPTAQGLDEALAAAAAQSPALAASWQAGLAAVQGIEAAIDQHAPAQGPDFAPLRKLMQYVAEAGGQAAQSSAPAGQDAAVSGPAAPNGPAAAAMPAGIGSREDAIRALTRVCEWFERNEPGHPAPLLIRRAQRLMSKNFIDIVRDLVPDGVSQIERLAGIGNE